LAPPLLIKRKTSPKMISKTSTHPMTIPAMAPAGRPLADVDEDAPDAVVVVEEPELEVVVVTGHGQ
jgi:hypothetical protein